MRTFPKITAFLITVILSTGCSFPPVENPQYVYAYDGSPLHIIGTAQPSSSIQPDTVIITADPPYSHEDTENSSSSASFSDYSAPPVPPYHRRVSEDSEPYERDYEDYITEPAVPIIIQGTDEPQFHGDDNNGILPHSS